MENFRVLIVDDEPNIRDLLSTSLKFAGFSVMAVGNGVQAVKAAEEANPDIILLDVMLPDMNGFSVTKKIRSLGIMAPVLFLTARDDTEDKIMGLTVGGDDYVTKPFSPKELMARIKAVIRRVAPTSLDEVIRVSEYLDTDPAAVLTDAGAGDD